MRLAENPSPFLARISAVRRNRILAMAKLVDSPAAARRLFELICAEVFVYAMPDDLDAWQAVYDRLDAVARGERSTFGDVDALLDPVEASLMPYPNPAVPLAKRGLTALRHALRRLTRTLNAPPKTVTLSQDRVPLPGRFTLPALATKSVGGMRSDAGTLRSSASRGA